MNDAPKIIKNIEASSWDDWLEKVESDLKDYGYKKYKQNIKREEFAYWKSFYDNDDKIYQIGLLFYDYRKYLDIDPNCNRIGVQFEFMPINIDGRVDLSVCKDNLTLEEFEKMSKDFYKKILKKYEK